MKKLKIILIGLVVITTVACGNVENKKIDVNSEIFTIESESRLDNKTRLTIVVHEPTGKRFVLYDGYNGVGIAPLY